MTLGRTVVVLFLAVLQDAAGAQPGAPLSLSAAVENAVKNHPLIKTADLGVDQAHNRSAEAQAGRLPKITISENMVTGNNPVFVFGSLLEQSRFGPENFELQSLNNPSSLTNFRSAVSVSLPLLDRRISSRIDQSRSGRDIALLQRELAEQQVRFEVLQSYFNVVLTDSAVEVADGAIRTAESDVRRARDRVEAGLGVYSDLLAAEVQLAEFRQQRIQAVGQKVVAVASLNVAMGVPPAAPHTLLLRFIKRSFILPSSEDLYLRAVSNRPDYQSSQRAIDIARQRIGEEGPVYMPDFNVFASAGASGRHPFSGSGDYSVGVGVTLNLLDRGRSAKVAQAQVDKELAETNRNRIADQIRIEVISAYQRYRAAEQQFEVAAAALTQATEGLRIIQDRYDAGLTTITELLRSETAFARARLNVTAALHAQYLGYASVLLSTGELRDVEVFEP